MLEARFLIALIALLSIGCMLGPGVQGSGNVKAEMRELGRFTGIDLEGAADVNVTIGEQQSVLVETDDNILPIIETTLDGDRLVISSKDNFRSSKGVKVRITVARLEAARISGSGSITATGVKSGKFEAAVSGSGDLRISGEAESLNAVVTGSGDIDTTKLEAADATVTVTGSGDVKISASKSISASVTGSGDVRYTGKPSQVQKSVTGSGTIKEM